MTQRFIGKAGRPETMTRTRGAVRQLYLAAIFAGLTSPLTAQNDPVANLMYPLNQRVRVTAPSLITRPIVGRVLTVDSQVVRLSVTDKGTSVAIPLSQVTKLQSSGGIDRGKGVRRGALAGLAAGVLVLGTTYQEIRESDPFGIGRLAIGAVALGIMPGIGALAGYVLAPESWDALQIPEVGASTPGRIELRLAADEQVRVRNGSDSFSGRVQAQTADVVTLATKDGNLALPLGELTRVAVSGDRSRRRGAARGVVIITAITAIGIATDPLPTFGENLGVAAGNAVFGGVIGMFFPMRSWMDLPPPRAAP